MTTTVLDRVVRWNLDINGDSYGDERERFRWYEGIAAAFSVQSLLVPWAAVQPKQATDWRWRQPVDRDHQHSTLILLVLDGEATEATVDPSWVGGLPGYQATHLVCPSRQSHPGLAAQSIPGRLGRRPNVTSPGPCSLAVLTRPRPSWGPAGRC